MNDEENKNYGGSTENDSKVLGKILLFFGLLFFLPAVGLALTMYYTLLRKLRQKASVDFIVTSLIILLSYVIWRISNAGARALEVFQNVRNIDLYWTGLIPAYISVNLVLGAVVAFAFIYWDIRQMKSNPWRLELEGSWMYKFKFRRTPWEYRKRLKKIENLKNGKYQSRDKIATGIDDDDNIVYRYNSEMLMSTILSGTTGSGKTITLLNSMISDIINGISILVVDFKRSAEFSSKLATWAKENGRNFYHFQNGKEEDYHVPNSPGLSNYDPILNGGAAKPDMILNMREYDTAASVYKQGMRELLQTLFNIMDNADQTKTKNIKWNQGEIYKINSIVNGLNGSAQGNLSELIDATEGTPVEMIARDFELKVKKKDTSLNRAYLALQGQINTLMNSEYGRWLKYEEGGRNIDLFKLLKEPGNVILFSMDGESEKDFAKYMGSLIFSDLSAVSAKRRRQGIEDYVSVYIDEFQAVSPTSIAPIIEKSRASGFGITMASQSYEQIISAAQNNGEAHLNSLLDTSANFIVHAGATEKSAERLSNIVGKDEKTVYRQANQNQSFFFSLNWKNRRNQTVHTSKENDWIAPPKRFMNLSLPKKANDFLTTAVIVKKSSDDPRNSGNVGTVVKKTMMIPNSKVLEQYFDGVEPDDEQKMSTIIENQLDNMVDEPEFNFMSSPDSYDDSDTQQPYDPADELDDVRFDDEDIEEDDGDFSFTTIDDNHSDEMLNLLDFDNVEPKKKNSGDVQRSNNVSVSQSSSNSANFSESIPTKSNGSLPTRPNQGLPKRSATVSRPVEGSKPSFESMVGSSDFKPSKRVKERPPVIEDVDPDDDALPDVDFD